MKVETWTIAGCGVFFLLIAPIYWLLTGDWTGSTALVMTTLLCVMLGAYLGTIARQIPERPEDDAYGDIADGAGELGFFPPYSWWPLFCAAALAVTTIGFVIGWWLFIIGSVFLAVCVMGWVFEYYRGIHAH